MNKILIIIFFVLFSIYNSYAQNIFGVYHGSLISDKNLMYIEDGGKYCVVKIFFSEKQSIQTLGEYSNGKLTFPLPQNEGEDLIVLAKIDKTSTKLNVEFEIDGHNNNTIFQKIKSPKKNLEKSWFNEPNMDSFDPKIIGNWVHYLTTDSLGNSYEGDFLSKKRYTKSFLKNGVVLYDVQMIRDAYKEYGVKIPVNYTAIPSASWFTSPNNRITIVIGAEVTEYHYEVSSDSLKFSSKMGSKMYFVKK
jgi:hypothetical protein